MSHHNPRHPHRHHVKRPELPPSNGSLFWLVMICLAGGIGLGYCLSRPALPPEPVAIQQPEPSGPIPDILPVEERTALPDPVPASTVEDGSKLSHPPREPEPVKPHAKPEAEPDRHHKAIHRICPHRGHHHKHHKRHRRDD